MSAERRALYPGSFDPPTNGHVQMMEYVSQNYDKGFVAIGFNPEKPGRFPVAEREEMLKEIAEEFPNLIVTSFLGQYQADFAETLGAEVIERGVRNTTDFLYENDIIQINRNINPKVETNVKIPRNEFMQVSSSMVMGLVGFEGWEEPVSTMVPGNVFERIKVKQEEKDKVALQQKFISLHERLGVEGNPSDFFDVLYGYYTQPHRSYHTMDHMKTCLNELELVRHLAEKPDELELALWFHDSIYESSRVRKPGENEKSETVTDEEMSAAFASPYITHVMRLPQETGDNVSSLILATKHTEEPKTQDEKLITDIDLAILGRSERLYDIYERKIREEYAWVPDDFFSKKRSEILERFLERPSIYHTPFFQERYERQARENLQRAIKTLRQ